MIHVAVDEHYSGLELLQRHSDLKITSFSEFSDLKSTNTVDALLVRTNKKIDSKVLDHFPNLQFIATASAGYDHLDIHELYRRNISWSRSAGCNAKSVAEYVFATLLFTLPENIALNLASKTLGIIGLGECGTQVKKIADNIGMKVVAYDPPKADRDKSFASCDIDELRTVDYLTTHVPLTDSTRYIVNRKLLQDSSISVVVNAARGGVLDESTISQFPDINFILDVWEGEPRFNSDIANRVSVSTPHIAGYSHSAKWRASAMAYDAMLNFFNLTKMGFTDKVDSKILPASSNIRQLVSSAHPFMEYQNHLNSIQSLSLEQKANEFQNIRNTVTLRHEFHQILFEGEFESSEMRQLVVDLGFLV